MKFDLTSVAQAVVSLFFTVITAFAIPILKEKLSQNKQENLRFWVETAVLAAEQLFSGKSGIEKKEYVVSFLLSKGIVIDVDEVTALIESSVKKLCNPQRSNIKSSI